MSTKGVATGHAVSPDSGEHWANEGAWQVADGIHRIPLPLPMDALKAINVYVVEGDDGLTLIDGGWSIPVARELLDKSLRSIGSGFGDIKRFLVTHVHRDHFTMATVLGHEYGAEVALGIDERPALELLHRASLGEIEGSPFLEVLRTAGAADIADLWEAGHDGELPDAVDWAFPDLWLEGDRRFEVGHRTIDAVHTPGHTPGHYVYADQAEGVLFAGDHVLPTITPSIGFTVPAVEQPLGQFMASLARVRQLPDLRILPAHGPVAPSVVRTRRRAARPPRGAPRPVPGVAAGARHGDVARRREGPRLDPPRAGLRRARRLQPGHGGDGDQGPPRPARRTRPGHVGGPGRRGGVRGRKLGRSDRGARATG